MVHPEEFIDYYDLLESDHTATERELQKAFRKQAVKFHPDKNPTQEAAARFHLLTIASDIFSDLEARRNYDATWKQHMASRQRREQLDQERRQWIEVLERNERSSATNWQHHLQKKDGRLQEVARQGAQMRALLSKRLQEARRKTSSVSASRVSSYCEPNSSTSRNGQQASDRTILVIYKGPPKVEIELYAIFAKYGHINEIVLHHSDNATQTILIEFQSLESAQRLITLPLSEIQAIDVRALGPSRELQGRHYIKLDSDAKLKQEKWSSDTQGKIPRPSPAENVSRNGNMLPSPPLIPLEIAILSKMRHFRPVKA